MSKGRSTVPPPSVNPRIPRRAPAPGLTERARKQVDENQTRVRKNLEQAAAYAAARKSR